MANEQVPTGLEGNTRLVALPGVWGIYGPPGAGKTIDEIRAFPNGYIICSSAADLRSVEARLGFAPPADRVIELNQGGLSDVKRALERLFPGNKNPKNIPSVIVDELNTFVDREVAAQSKIVKDGRMMYKLVNDDLTVLFDYFRVINAAGVDIAWNAHANEPTYEETKQKDGSIVWGELLKAGGAALPGQMVKTAAKRSDAILRYGFDAQRSGRHKISAFAGMSNGGEEYMQKDRLGVVSRSPANLAEILRSCGRRVPRWIGSNGQPVVDTLLEHYINEGIKQMSSPTEPPVLCAKRVAAWIQEWATQQKWTNEQTLPILRWAMDDTLARVELRQMKETSKVLLDEYGIV